MVINIKIVNKQIRSKERIMLVLLAIIVCSFSLFNLVLLILSNFIEPVNKVMGFIGNLKSLLWNLILLILWYFQLKRISQIMKRNLYYYFISKWKSIRFVFRINIVVFILIILLNLISYIVVIDDISLIKDSKSHEDYVRLLFFIPLLTINIWRFLYN